MTENAKKFLELVSSDEALKEKLKNVKSLEEALKIAAERGFQLTEEDIREESQGKGEVALDDDEAEAVAGGVCACPVAGGGTAGGKQCACFLYGHGKDDNGHGMECLGWGGVGDDVEVGTVNGFDSKSADTPAYARNE